MSAGVVVIKIWVVSLTVTCDIWIVSIGHTGGDLGDWKIVVSLWHERPGRLNDTR